jgi:hypothetical protein
MAKDKFQTDSLLREKKKKEKGEKDRPEQVLWKFLLNLCNKELEEDFKGMSRQEILKIKKQRQEVDRETARKRLQEEREEVENEKKVLDVWIIVTWQKSRLEQEITKVAQQLRTKPLGYDRHFNRYWIFHGNLGIAEVWQ